MIEKEVFDQIKIFLTGSSGAPLYAYRNDVVRIHETDIRGDKCLLIGVENGRALAPGVPFRQFDVTIGFAIRYTDTAYRTTAETVISTIRKNADALAAHLKSFTGSTGTEIAQIDAFYPTVNAQETEGVDESDKYFIHSIPFTLFLSRKDS